MSDRMKLMDRIRSWFDTPPILDPPPGTTRRERGWLGLDDEPVGDNEKDQAITDGCLPDEPDGTEGPIQQPRLRYATVDDVREDTQEDTQEGDLLYPEDWNLERFAWELFRLQNRADASREREAALQKHVTNLAMALRYYLHDHPDNCVCYACSTVAKNDGN